MAQHGQKGRIVANDCIGSGGEEQVQSVLLPSPQPTFCCNSSAARGCRADGCTIERWSASRIARASGYAASLLPSTVSAHTACGISVQVFCYAITDLRKEEEADEVLRFVTFWEQWYGERPRHLVFDSKLTTYRNLSKLNALGITFITLRRRSPKLVAECATLPRAAWRTVELEVPHRKFKTPRVVDQRVELAGYTGTLRQLLIRDLGHAEPTILLTNDLTSSLKAIITRYAQRMLIENGLADSVAFFHLDALSSAVALNVDFGVLLTVIASGIYRLFAKGLRGYERAQARQLFRRFLDTTARVTIAEQEITVRLPRRAHNPILLDADLIGVPAAIPWWGGHPLRLEIV